jgi:Flp pilus assembly protein TadB
MSSMAWQMYRPPSPDAEAANSLSKYQAGLRAAELRARSEINLDTESPAVSGFNAKRLRNVLLLWAVVAFAIAGLATWFLDRVLAAEIVVVVTAIVILTPVARMRRTG